MQRLCTVCLHRGELQIYTEATSTLGARGVTPSSHSHAHTKTCRASELSSVAGIVQEVLSGAMGYLYQICTYGVQEGWYSALLACAAAHCCPCYSGYTIFSTLACWELVYLCLCKLRMTPPAPRVGIAGVLMTNHGWTALETNILPEEQ